jgi:RNA polymerase sigma-54 factor
LKPECVVLQEQKQILSQYQRESLQILGMDAQELHEFMIREQNENPLLNFAEGKSPGLMTRKGTSVAWNGSLDIPAPSEESVQDFLLSQLRLNDYSPEEVEAFQILTGVVDERGFLKNSPEELSEIFRIPKPLLDRCLSVLQNLSPSGVCCLTLEECLLRQLEDRGVYDGVLLRIVQSHLADVGKGGLRRIARALGVDIARITRSVAVLTSLNPNPLNGLRGEMAPYAIPDILLIRENGFWEVELNDRWFENFEACDYYEKMARETEDDELQNYLREKSQRIRFLNEALERRRNTLLRIGRSLAVHYSDFFLYGVPFSVFTMADLAEEMQMHPSTISRAVKNKYLQHPRGICEIRSLFAQGVSSTDFCVRMSREEVKARLRKLIADEDRRTPGSDECLAQLLAEQGIRISRRTVAKYREELGFSGMHDRRIGV